jgi:hypothetical protein
MFIEGNPQVFIQVGSGYSTPIEMKIKVRNKENETLSFQKIEFRKRKRLTILKRFQGMKTISDSKKQKRFTISKLKMSGFSKTRTISEM